MKVDIIKRVFSNRDKADETSLVIGLDKDQTFYVYTIPEFLRIYTGKDEKEAFKYFNKYENGYDETESYI
jgi:hypothetical protein